MDDATNPKPAPEMGQDLVLLHGRTDDGAGYRGVRAHEGRVELTEIRPAKEGQPIHSSELVALHPRPSFPLLCDVEVLFRRGEEQEHESAGESAPAGSGHAGPARVSSRSYRENWEQIFRAPPSRKGKPEPAN